MIRPSAANVARTGAYRPKARAQIKTNLEFSFECFPRLKERSKDRADGRAEFSAGAAHRRSRLCDLARHDRVRGRLGGRAQQQRPDPDVFSGCDRARAADFFSVCGDN
jgi:hypothetical protein